MDEALDEALAKKNLKALSRALESKPSLTELDSDGKSALHRAVTFKSLECAEALLAAGASLDVPDEDGNTPLYALLKSKTGSMSALEQTNARWLIEKGASLDVPGEYGQTALHHAADSAPLALLELLLDGGAKSVKDEGGNTPLYRCLSTHFTDQKVWTLLLAHGCSVTDVNEAGETPLHEAVTDHNPAAVKFLLAKKADPAAKNGAGETPLQLAIRYKNQKIAALFAS